MWVLPLLVFAFMYLFKSYFFPIHDFANYYFGAFSIVHDFFSIDIYNALNFNKALENKGFENIFVSYYPNTPFLSFFFLPLSVLDWPFAKILFNLLGFVLFLYTLTVFIKEYSLPHIVLLLIPLFFFIPIKNNILFGQMYLLIFSLMGLGFILYMKNKKAIASILWAVCILLKVFPIVILPWLILRKDMKGTSMLILACVSLLLLSVPFCGVESWSYFFSNVFPDSSAGIIYDGFTPKAKSALMLFKNTFVYDSLLNPSPIVNSTWMNIISLLAYKFFIVGTCASVTLSNTLGLENKPIASFSLWMVASLLIGPTSSSYSQILLLFPLLSIFNNYKASEKVRTIILIGLIFIAANLPMHYFYELPLFLKFPRVYTLIILFLMLSIPLYKKINPLLLLSLFSFLLGSQLLSKKGNSLYKYVDSGINYPAMLTDYSIENDTLSFYHWTNNGIEKIKTQLKLQLVDSLKVDIVDNQIFYQGTPITDSPDSKIKAHVVDSNKIIFLTDYNRGPGFYSLRQIDLPSN